MKRLLLCLLLALPVPALADEPLVKVRSQLLPGDSVLVGGTLSLQLDLLVDTWFSAAPQLPKLALDGAVVSVPSGEATHLTEQIDGKPFFGLRYSYQITPQQARAFDIPALAIQVRPGQGSGPLTVHSQPLHFTAREPAGGEAGAQRLVARQLDFSQVLEQSHKPLRVGDSVTRRLHVRAEGAQAMLIPAPAFAEVDGLRRYVQTPTVKPMGDGRGGVDGGEREDAATYVVGEAGRFSLPAIELRWWDATTGEQKSATVPALDLEARGAAGYQAPFSITEDLRRLGQKAQVHIAGHWLLIGLALVLLAALAFAGQHWGAPLVGQWRSWRQRRQQAWLDSAEYAWRQVRPQLEGSPPQLGALYLWLRRRTGCHEMSSAFGRLPEPTVDYLLAFFRTRYGREHRADTPEALLKALPGLPKAVAEHDEPAPAHHSLKPLNP
ncbi:Oxygen tolerance [Pseudomonas delhiensis]|uniref:Oxygen tolerance n=1 Tax=Pseudomonas delhiensis TaxID=366289 RepID=A0A239M322_9PSED|nr:BatD family protein [Pseudomonas delhiensis]SDJ39916.1 Oxygen tolerance [Pseudomonas delhiensis]SNT37000.1 Oxygen tolerance [Pseudomonas delhiensis]